MQEPEEYETHDIYLAAYFTVAGCQMVRRRRAGQRVFFVFRNPAGSMQDMREAYYSNRGTVPAARYAQEVMAMKQLCHE